MSSQIFPIITSYKATWQLIRISIVLQKRTGSTLPFCHFMLKIMEPNSMFFDASV